MNVEGSTAPAGSSPLTRGKQRRMARPGDTHGLIPAHAGKTLASSGPTRAPRAHPRSRGENAVRLPWVRASGGSSPLTRGKPASIERTRTPKGLIPAHAGKTIGVSFIELQGAAHPRSRGENYSRSPRVSAFMGSSPLTRGKPWQLPPPRSSQRLIPAHAGKTRSGAATCQARPAHPRSRGENP